MPKGGRKGGVVFPRYSLQECLNWSKKLVSKTHVEPQPIAVIYSGVVGAKGSTGDIKISSLKQFGLLDGTRNGYSATDLAKKINAAPDAETLQLLKTSVLLPRVFKLIFDTFQGDAAARSKIRQRVCDLDVHPEQASVCVDVWVKSMVRAGLATVDGDRVLVSPVKDLSIPVASNDKADPPAEDATNSDDDILAADQDDSSELADGISDNIPTRPPRATFTVNVTLDASLDIDKLGRQLALLKKFGAI